MPRHNHTSKPDPEEAVNSLWSRTSCQFRVSSWKSRAEFEDKSGIRFIDRELSAYYEPVYLDLPRATFEGPFPGLSCDDLIEYILGDDGQQNPVISTSCSFIWALWNMTVHWARGWVGLDDAVCLELILPKAPRGRPGSVGFKAISLLRAMSDYHTNWDFCRARNYASVSEQVLYFGKIDRCRIRWRHVFSVQEFLDFLPARLFPEERRAIGSRLLADLDCSVRFSFKQDMRWSPLGLLHRERNETKPTKIRLPSVYFDPEDQSDLEDSETDPPWNLADIPASVIAQELDKCKTTVAGWNKQEERRKQPGISALLKKFEEQESKKESDQNDESVPDVEDRSDEVDDLTSVMASVSIEASCLLENWVPGPRSVIS